MNNQGTSKNQQEEVPISFPPVGVTPPIESNETLGYNSTSEKPEEFNPQLFYSGNISYAIVPQTVQQRELETVPSTDLNSVGTDGIQQQMDYTIVNAFNPVYSISGNNIISQPLPYTTNLTQSGVHGIKDIGLQDAPHIITYQPLLQGSSITMPSCHPSQDKNAPLNDSNQLEMSYCASDVHPFHSSYLTTTDHQSDSDSNEDLSSEKRRSQYSLPKPKRVRTAYNFFSRDYFNSLKEGYSTHDSIRDAASIWKDLPEEKRNEYQKRSDLDRIRYDEELKKYSTRFKKYGLPSMNGKRERQAFLYHCITTNDIPKLASFILLLNNEKLDYSLAFVDASLKLIEEQAHCGDPEEQLKEMSFKKNAYPLVFRCYEQNCNKVFHSLRSLNIHKRAHSQTTEKLVCDYPGCGKVYTTMSGLKKHKKSHDSNQEVFVCSLCSEQRTFKTKEGLILHQKNKHSQSRDHVCGEIGCGKTFARKEDLRLHIIRCHSRIKPYQCTEEGCGKCFASSSELKRHYRLHQK